MQKDIHPKTQSVDVTCSTCSTKYTFVSSKTNIHADICASCHPFYTGDRSMAKSTGQIDKFNRRYIKTNKK
ncbi:large subunit ribosomal protein L31 [Mycoplasma testudineum]|uniref:50S ribosomal protein L31 n=1 Tax=Mycoplasma testudineum TaxID=244584 RepID=A0A4R6IFF4_9MOLU|nr:50S ribosomal protein L31 [Mycoplasma testudineum]OYD26969.1 50S ribosomal protein L31 [Mycoplasma testudineum]TDO20516.1 large subunit ribosomal protein L31 [Mycoplasma testudineum]